MKQVDFISAKAYPLQGHIKVPGDKSISHRAIMFAAIAEGTSTIDGFLDGADCLATLAAFRIMGVTVEGPIAQRLVIHGVGRLGLTAPQRTIDCGNSGTTMRLLSGLLAGQTFSSQLSGDNSLLKRPMARICQPLSLMGARIMSCDGHAPLLIEGGSRLNGRCYTMPVASAQVKSAILLAGLYAQGESTVIEPAISRDHTERMLATFSYPVQTKEKTVSVQGGGQCLAADIKVPGDISSAAFFMVAATVIPGSNIIIQNVGINPTRCGVIEILTLMGADIRLLNPRQYGEEPVADIAVKYAALTGITIPSTLVPLAIDEFPVLFIAAACAKGQTSLRGASELRVKESDRIAAMVKGLTTLGIEAQALDDGVVIQGGRMRGGVVDSAQDHRIAMAFAIAGSVAADCITIKDSFNVQTSFPGFVHTAQQLGLCIKETIL
ncbi:MAG: 3-phosphoshikimate 1-carboxyvinyltransferase [Legionellaceae bacterium]|nr:3-phosphoshikimate 1-carboxyvinyltransferase [Legionellaceae bacterium]